MSVISEDHANSFLKLFSYIYKDDYEATRVSMELVQIAHVWDDLIDKDVEVGYEEINAAFVGALCEVGGSYLWDRQAAELLRVQFFKWLASNKIEATPDATTEQKMIAYAARAGFYDLFYYFAFKLHGVEWAASVAPDIASWYGESAEDYMIEFWR